MAVSVTGTFYFVKMLKLPCEHTREKISLIVLDVSW